MVTVTQLVSYVLRHRKGNAFKDWTTPEICYAINVGIDSKCCVADVDNFGNINGIIIGNPNDANKTIHIIGVITTRKCALRNFITWLRNNFPSDWRITATRNGKLVEYDTKKLLNKLYGRPKKSI